MKKETRVEVQRDGAWMEAIVVVAYALGRWRRYKVRYNNHHHDGQPLTEEDVPFTRVRPIPPHTPHNYNYSILDAVEVSDKGCWWQGTITQVMFTNSELFLIYLRHSGVHKVYHYSKLRPAQEWLKGKWSHLPSQLTSNIIYERKYPIAADSGITSVASSPWDVQANAQSQRQFEEQEVEKQRRHCDGIENRATLNVEECSIQAIRNSDSRRPKTFNHGSAISKNAVAVSQEESINVEGNQRRNSLAPLSKGVKRVYVHDGRNDRMYGGIQDTPGNDIKRFKHTKPKTATEKIQIRVLKNIETSAGSCTGNATLGYSRTELDNKPRRNNPLNVVAKQRLQTHERELLAYRLVLKAFYAQTYLTWERNNLLTSLRQELHITSDEYTDELKKLISDS